MGASNLFEFCILLERNLLCDGEKCDIAALRALQRNLHDINVWMKHFEKF